MQLAIDPSQMVYSDNVGPTAQRLFSHWQPIVREHIRCVGDLWEDSRRLGGGPEMDLGALEFDLADCRRNYARAQKLSEHVYAFERKHLSSWWSLVKSSTRNLESGLENEIKLEEELIKGMEACGMQILEDLKPGEMTIHSLKMLPSTEQAAREQARWKVLDRNEEPVIDFYPCLRLLQILVAGNETLSQIERDLEDPPNGGSPGRTWLIRLNRLKQRIEDILQGRDE